MNLIKKVFYCIEEGKTSFVGFQSRQGNVAESARWTEMIEWRINWDVG